MSLTNQISWPSFSNKSPMYQYCPKRTAKISSKHQEDEDTATGLDLAKYDLDVPNKKI
jgi:hypothetical protein